MAVSYRKRDKQKLGRDLASKIVQARRNLVALNAKAKRAGRFSDAQKAQALRLIKDINRWKAALVQMGYDPKQAAHAIVAAEKAKRSTGSGKYAPKRAKRNGIGMYSLGNTLKIWK